MSLSAGHALVERERTFCRTYLALLGNDPPPEDEAVHAEMVLEAWYMVYCPEEVFSDAGEWEDNPKRAALDIRKARRQSAKLFKKSALQRYLDELRRPALDSALNVITDEMLTGTDAAGRRKAAELTLAQEEKHGKQAATDIWAERMCAVGAEVVVPVHDGGEVVFPLTHIFPQYETASPPDEIVEKSISTLQAMLTRRVELAADDHS